MLVWIATTFQKHDSNTRTSGEMIVFERLSLRCVGQYLLDHIEFHPESGGDGRKWLLSSMEEDEGDDAYTTFEPPSSRGEKEVVLAEPSQEEQG